MFSAPKVLKNHSNDGKMLLSIHLDYYPNNHTWGMRKTLGRKKMGQDFFFISLNPPWKQTQKIEWQNQRPTDNIYDKTKGYSMLKNSKTWEGIDEPPSLYYQLQNPCNIKNCLRRSRGKGNRDSDSFRWRDSQIFQQ